MKNCDWARGIISRVLEKGEGDMMANQMLRAAIKVCSTCQCGQCAPLMVELDRQSDPPRKGRRRAATA